VPKFGHREFVRNSIANSIRFDEALPIIVAPTEDRNWKTFKAAGTTLIIETIPCLRIAPGKMAHRLIIDAGFALKSEESPRVLGIES